MEQGPTERRVIRQCLKLGMPLPDSIAGAPKLRAGLEPYWAAFQVLTTERHPGMMGPPGRVPWRAIMEYARVYGLYGAAYEDFEQIMLAMDEAYVEWVAAKIERDRPS